MKSMKTSEKVDMSVEFCGIRFQNPFLLASSPPAATMEMIGRAFEAGWAGAVTKTLVIDEKAWVDVTPRYWSLGFRSAAKESKRMYAFENIELGTQRSFAVWLKEVEQLRKKYPQHVIIASIMDDASKPDGWQYMAKKLEEAGAHMLELNFSCPHGMTELGGMGAAIGQNQDLSKTITQWVADTVKIPVMPKMTANAADVGVIAKACAAGGAKAIAGINTVAAIIGIDLETFVPRPSVAEYSAFGGLSGLAIKPIALKSVASMATAVKLPISGLGGINSWEDAAEFLLLGASTLQLCTAVMTRGYGILGGLMDGLQEYMKRKEFNKISEMVGLSLGKLTQHMDLSREARVASSISKKLCIKCQRCFISCRDAETQAIRINKDKFPLVDRVKCSGCSLCQQVCPVPDCIKMTPFKGARA